MKDSVQEASRNTAIAEKESRQELKMKRDSLANEKQMQALAASKALEQRRQKDSIASAKAMEQALAVAEQQRQDSIARTEAILAEAERKKAELAARTEVVKPMAGEKYEEVSKEGSLTPGYYLIANVFGTKKYFDAFMAEMTKKGLNPKSFYREMNKYNYVYLGKYNTIEEARTARDSKLNGTYVEKLWIFRVTGE